MPKSSFCKADIPATAALKPGIVVMHETDLDTAAVLIRKPSCLEPRPNGVFITNWTSPLVITSFADSWFELLSEFFLTSSDGTPFSERNAFVPEVL